MIYHTALLVAVLLSSATYLPAPAKAASCESLADLKLPNTTISSAETVAAGAFTLPAGSPPQPGGFAAFKMLPAFCRVKGVIEPSTDSHIEFEVWLPTSGWNGRYQGAGNGGFGGYINFSGLAEAVNNGYAGSSTDTGHEASGTNAEWALGHHEKLVDYFYRAIHDTAENAKAIIQAFYGAGPKYSYFSSCSNGGRQALMEAQRYPADYDGIIAGAPANFFSRAGVSLRWNVYATEADRASYIPASKLPTIQGAALAACDTAKDGFIDDPTKCRFDPTKLLCNGAESNSCLTQPQVAALKKIYTGPRNSNGEQLYPGLMPGGEADPQGWLLWITGAAPGQSLVYTFSTQATKYMVFQDPAMHYWALNFDGDTKRDDEVLADGNATNANLKAFRSRGGKLILYHGWNDPALSPMNTVNYYRSVVSTMGRGADFIRLYMVPGMLHCAGGPGPNSFGAGTPSAQADSEHSMSMALEHWVEKGVAPAAIIATKYRNNLDPTSGVVRTRPLCPYPQAAQYTGPDSRDEAANFVCSVPAK